MNKGSHNLFRKWIVKVLGNFEQPRVSPQNTAADCFEPC